MEQMEQIGNVVQCELRSDGLPYIPFEFQLGILNGSVGRIERPECVPVFRKPRTVRSKYRVATGTTLNNRTTHRMTCPKCLLLREKQLKQIADGAEDKNPIKTFHGGMRYRTEDGGKFYNSPACGHSFFLPD